MVARADVTAVLEGCRELTPTSYVARFRLEEPFTPPAPGQFVMVRPAAGDNPFWRRAYSVAGFAPSDGGGTLELMIKVIGPGTALWRQTPPGTRALVLGPLGNGFDLKPGLERVALVAGGIGLPPLLYALPPLAAAGVRCDLFLGAATASELLDPHGCERSVSATGGGLVVTTDDGSAGEPGYVTEAFGRRTAAGERWDVVLACGPMPMLRALARILAQHAMRGQFALEERMACGVGVCLGCIVPTVDGGHLRVCSEGPVVEADRVQWEAAC